MIVAPVYSPLSCGPENCTDGNATVDVWLPPTHSWVAFPSLHHGGSYTNAASVFNGSTTMQAVQCQLDDVPVFVRRGAILPMLPYSVAIRHGSAARPWGTLDLWWYPHVDRQSTSTSTLVEDDGMSTDYLAGQGVLTTSIVIDYMDAHCTRWNITHEGSAFVGMPQRRRTSLRVVDAADVAPHPLPSTVTLNGHLLPESASKRVAGDRYAGPGLTIALPALGYMQDVVVIVCS